jgi:hypothetical protein
LRTNELERTRWSRTMAEISWARLFLEILIETLFMNGNGKG